MVNWLGFVVGRWLECESALQKYQPSSRLRSRFYKNLFKRLYYSQRNIMACHLRLYQAEQMLLLSVYNDKQLKMS